MAENETRNTNAPDIGQMVEQIMKNPEFTGIINELRGGSGDAPPVSQGEILSRLPDVMSMLKPLIGEGGGKTEETPVKTDSSAETIPPERQDSVPASAEASKAVSALLPKRYDKNRAEKLMSALKPYLNASRCEIIDKCVSVMQITDVVGALQGIESLTKPKP